MRLSTYSSRKNVSALWCSPSSWYLTQCAHVATGTERAVAGTLDHDAVHMRIVTPLPERPRAGADHRQVERVERLRAVQHDAPHAPVASGDHGLFVWHSPLRDGSCI